MSQYTANGTVTDNVFSLTASDILTTVQGGSRQAVLYASTFSQVIMNDDAPMALVVARCNNSSGHRRASRDDLGGRERLVVEGMV